jgi:hypothetical protein
MTTSADKPPMRESKGSLCARPYERCTWLPILGGVLSGMIACLVLASLERPAFYRLTILIFKETSPKQLFIAPGYDYVWRAVLLALAAVGGSVGVRFSQWRRTTSFLFLFAVLLVIAGFEALGLAFDASGGLWDALGHH